MGQFYGSCSVATVCGTGYTTANVFLCEARIPGVVAMYESVYKCSGKNWFAPYITHLDHTLYFQAALYS